MDTASYSQKDVEALFKVGAHLGHKKNRLHPKARAFVYKIENGVSIIDLTKTANQLTQAKKYLSQAAKDGKVMLVVATKKVISKFAEDLCKQNSIPYVSAKWLPGLITNFETIIKNVKKLKELKEDREKGNWDTFVKHEKVKLNKHLNRLEKFYGGLLTLEKRPEMIFIVDTKKERSAFTESSTSGIPIIAITDTNSNPNLVDYPIVANDDSPASVEYLVNELISAYTKKSNPEQLSSK